MRQKLHLWKIAGIFNLFVFLSLQTFAQTATPPSVGNGSEENPYEISNLENLYWLTQSSNAWDKHFIQTADIDASETQTWHNSNGLSPIGNGSIEFTGTYNGQHYKINNLYINRKNNKNIGLFGVTKNSNIEKLVLTNVDITGKKYVGAIAGRNLGTINKCYAEGKLKTKVSYIQARAGGLTGYNNDTIKSSFNRVNVSSEGHLIGGISGTITGTGLIINCYNQATISGEDHIGGIVGQLYDGKIKNSYSTAPIKGDEDIGGVVGAKYAGSIKNSFWDTENSGNNRSHGGNGKTTLEMINPYTFIKAGWDFMQESDNGEDNVWGINPNKNGGYPFLKWQGFGYLNPLLVKTIEVTDIDTNSASGKLKILSIDTSSITAHGLCWNTSSNPGIQDDYSTEGSLSDTGTYTSNISGLEPATKYYFRSYVSNSDTTIYGGEIITSTLPAFSKPAGEGSETDPYQIANLKNLAWLMFADTAWNRHYIQTADIDASETSEWDMNKGFTPIGNKTTKFTGNYNGDEHKISNLFINRPNQKFIGLFGRVTNGAEISNLGITNADLAGKGYVGGLTGILGSASVNNCYSSGNIEATGYNWMAYAGGLIGKNLGTAKECHSTMNITSSHSFLGGLIGANRGTVEDCYSAGKIKGTNYGRVGGFVGDNENGSITNSYSRGQVESKDDQFGGFNGYQKGTIKHCFWDKEASGVNKSEGGTGKTTLEMKNPSTFTDAGWDFMKETSNGEENTWGINPNENGGYPFLKWQGYAYLNPLLINTEEITNIRSTTVSGKIEIISLDTSSITAHGLCWDTLSSPGIQDDFSNEGSLSDTGTYKSNISGLEPATKYYFRSYVSNSDTTIYGDEIIISTLPAFSKPAGEGSETDPYQIANLKNLAWLMFADTAWNRHYIQTADIDASETSEWDMNKGFTPIGNKTTKFTGSYNGGGHKISNLFINRPNQEYIGLFGHADSGAEINNLGIINANISGGSTVGTLVGFLDYATVNSTHSSGKVVAKFSSVGGLIGLNKGNVYKSYTSTNVSSRSSFLGGFTGANRGTIKNCYSTGKVTGRYRESIGGFVGDNMYGTIKYSYSSGAVNSDGNDHGGFNGHNKGTIKHCYWDKEASGVNNSVGGTGKSSQKMRNHLTFTDNGWDFMNETDNGTENIWGINPNENGGYPFLKWQGFNYLNPIIIKTGKITNIDTTKATAGINIRAIDTSTITAHGVCWDTEPQPTLQNNYTNEGNVADTGIYSSNISDLQPTTLYYVRAYVSNSDTTVYGKQATLITTPPFAIPAGDGSEANPYQIASLDNLTWLMISDTAWDRHYIQTAEIDASATSGWFNNKGFRPIGNQTTKFTGFYNGDGYKIKNLTINRPDKRFIGLFGNANNGAEIKKLGLININIKGEAYIGGITGALGTGTITKCYSSGEIYAKGFFWKAYAGGLIGKNNGIVNKCYSNTNISSPDGILGGFVGANSGTITNSYAKGNISGQNDGRVGGFVGDNDDGTIENSFSQGHVECDDSEIGGFNGYNQGTINHCFWDKETSGLNQSEGGTGKTTREMRNHYMFIEQGWDFMNEIENGEKDIWGINPDKNDGYPFLEWQGFNYQVPLLINTAEIANIGNTSATGHGDIISTDESTITAHGLCWDTLPEPTIQDSYSDEGSVSDTGAFQSNITGMVANKDYYARAYVSNSDTTIYGNEITFTTLPYELELNGTFSVANKTYDGTNVAEIETNNLSLSGIIGDDDVTIKNVSIHYSDSEVGENKTVTITELILKGNDVDKYQMLENTFPSVNDARIYPKELTVVNATVQEKTYDGTTDAVITGATLQGVITGDNVVLENNTYGSFASAKVDTDIDVSTSMTISGQKAINYELTQPSNLTGNITPKDVTIGGSFNADSKVYDGTRNASITSNNLTLEGSLEQDNVSLISADASFTKTQPGENITVRIDAGEIDGIDAGNYSLSLTSAPTTIADITFKELTVANASVQDKSYDGTTEAIITGAELEGVIAGDNVVIDEKVGSFASEDVGDKIEVTTSLTITGSQAGNYQLTQPANLTGNIIAREATIDGTFNVANKDYDGTKEATITTNNLSLLNIIEDDDVLLADVKAAFAQSEPGSGITVNIKDARLEGIDSTNYSLSLANAPTTTADITGSTGFSNNSENSIRLYPNPVQDYMIIESDKEIKQIKIINMAGVARIIKNPDNRIHTSDLEKGIYLIILKDEQGNSYQQRIIRK
jgi:hypothetical protein